jgi:hypothetical protein
MSGTQTSEVTKLEVKAVSVSIFRSFRTENLDFGSAQHEKMCTLASIDLFAIIPLLVGIQLLLPLIHDPILHFKINLHYFNTLYFLVSIKDRKIERGVPDNIY